eukprot:SAG11_NODE_22700_length_401_cov_1.367550_1_plen_64_part_10
MAAAALQAWAKRPTFSIRSRKRQQVKGDGTLRGYIRHSYNSCEKIEELGYMKVELRRMIEMFAA